MFVFHELRAFYTAIMQPKNFLRVETALSLIKQLAIVLAASQCQQDQTEPYSHILL